MTPSQRKKLQAIVNKHLPPALSSLNPVDFDNSDRLWDTTLTLIDVLIKDKMRLEKDYKNLAVSASESFYSLASQLSKNSSNGADSHENIEG